MQANEEQQQEQPAQEPQQSKAMMRQVQSETALVGGSFAPQTLEQAIEVAKLMAYSGMLPKAFDRNVGAVLVAVQMGAELGLSPMASIQNIAVINGRPSLWGDAMLAVCQRHPLWGGIKESGDERAATCSIWRKGEPEPRTVTFTAEDARTAGLWGKQGPWTQYPKRMLQLRARAFALRDKFADALRGMSSAEEQQDIVDVKFEEAPAQLTPGTHSFGFSKKEQPKQEAAPKQEAEPEQAPAPDPEKVKQSRKPRSAAEEKWLAEKQAEAQAAMREPGVD